jgi:hypothetical protein
VKRVADDRLDPNKGEKTAALNTLKKLTPQEVRNALMVAQQSTNAEGKNWAIEELGRLKDDK